MMATVCLKFNNMCKCIPIYYAIADRCRDPLSAKHERSCNSWERHRRINHLTENNNIFDQFIPGLVCCESIIASTKRSQIWCVHHVFMFVSRIVQIINFMQKYNCIIKRWVYRCMTSLHRSIGVFTWNSLSNRRKRGEYERSVEICQKLCGIFPIAVAHFECECMEKW